MHSDTSTPFGKWENLKVYRNLPPAEIPLRFKEFAQLILASLNVHGFKLKETKTVKNLYRINEEFEQSIHFDNSNPWARNQKDIHIYISIKPLYSEKHQLYRIFEAFQIDSSFKMFYPLTQEFNLLAESLIDKIQEHILSFFDKFSTSERIVRGSKQLGAYYKIPNTDKAVVNADLRQLLYECAFLQREKSLFYNFNTEYLNERLRAYELLKDDIQYGPRNSALIDGIKRQQQIFDDDELYSQEIRSRSEKAKKYLESLNRKIPSNKF